jgi:DNA polymerase III subunit alpha
MRYVSLHHHSTYSYLDGFQLPDAHIRRATELNMLGLALTEHGNVSSHVQLEKAAQKQGVHPIFGCELYCGEVGENATQRKNHLTVLAETPEGYSNLLRLVSQGWSDFYYEPTVSGRTLGRYKKGLVVLSGCTGSLLATSLVGGKNVDPADASYSRAREVARRFQTSFGDSYYLEVQAFPELENVVAINKGVARISEELGIPLVATGDVHYTRPDENEMQQILHNVRAGNRQTLEDMARSWGYHVQLCPPMSDKLIRDKLMATGLSKRQATAAVLATEEIAQRCNVVLPKLPQLRYPVPAGHQDAASVWRDWLRAGWRYRAIHNMPPAVRNRYRERLKYEMSIIEGKDFIDYFLVVSDLVKFAKDTGIPVGPARGSAAASLVCFLLRITEVDPVVHSSLIFERFIDTTRQDLPDIDLDFDSERRHEIRSYLVAKYGSAQVSNIGTFTKYKAKNSLDDVARVYRIPQYEVDTVKELLLERSSGDLRASSTVQDTVDRFEAAKAVFERYPDLAKATSLEGNIKGMGVHAAGLVVSNGPITDVVAVYSRVVKGHEIDVVSVDKYDAAYLNLLKIDALGLDTMTMLAECLRLAGMTLEDLYGISLEDPAVIDGFKRNDVVGIFQFDGRAMRSVNAELQPDNFKEVCDCGALARPGPLHSGSSAEYIDLKRGRKTRGKAHPLLEAITTETHGQIIYQEQILRVVMEIGGFDWTHAAYIRKIISQKIGEQEFNRQWGRFLDGALERGLTEEEAHSIWSDCITAGAYAFNNAHTVSYGMISWWTMWFKVHHPLVFYIAALRKYPAKKQLELLKDAFRHDIVALPPHPIHSEMSWGSTDDGQLVGGLVQVPGIGEANAEKMLAYRDEYGVRDWKDYLVVKGIGPKKIENFESFAAEEDPYGILRLKNLLDSIRGQARALGLPRQTHTSTDIPYSRGQDIECVWYGVITNRNLRELFELHFSRTGEELDPKTVKNPELNEWVVMTGTDEDDIVSLTIDRWKYNRFKKAVWGIKVDHDVVVVRGIKRGQQGRRALYVKQMWVVDPSDEKEEEEEFLQ